MSTFTIKRGNDYTQPFIFPEAIDLSNVTSAKMSLKSMSGSIDANFDLTSGLSIDTVTNTLTLIVSDTICKTLSGTYTTDIKLTISGEIHNYPSGDPITITIEDVVTE
jgi:hypothetical protein